MNKAARIEQFAEFLRSEGYLPNIDKDGDIVFKFEGGTYLVIVDDADSQYFRILFPSFWAIESPSERTKAEQVAYRVTTDTKVAKVYLVSDNTWAAIEAFYASIDHAQAAFPRSMQALRSITRSFADGMRA